MLWWPKKFFFPATRFPLYSRSPSCFDFPTAGDHSSKDAVACPEEILSRPSKRRIVRVAKKIKEIFFSANPQEGYQRIHPFGVDDGNAI